MPSVLLRTFDFICDKSISKRNVNKMNLKYIITAIILCSTSTLIISQNETGNLDTLEYSKSMLQKNKKVTVSGLYNSFHCSDSEVLSSELKEGRAYDATRIMQSKLAGLSISANSYTPGASSRMLLRGFRSFRNNNQPIVLFNGLPINNSEWNNSIGHTDQSNRLIDIDPNFIESIEVVKSMATRARYGLIGGNGIISIRTKKGHIGKPRITIKTSIGIDELSNTPLLQDTWAQGRTIAGEQIYNGPETMDGFSWGPEIKDLIYDGNSSYPFDKNGQLIPANGNNGKAANVYNPLDFFQNAIGSNVSLQFAGGKNKLDYLFLASSNNQKGVIPTNQYDRYNLSSAINYKASDKLSMQLNAQVTKSIAHRSIKGSSVNGVMLGLLRTPATFDNSNGLSDPVNDSNAYELSNGAQRSFRSGVYDNPYWSINKNKHRDDVSRLIANISGQYQLSEKLSFLINLGSDGYLDFRKGGVDINLDFHEGRAYSRKANYNAQNIDASAVYKIKKSELLSIESTLGFNYNQRKTNFEVVEGFSLRSSNNVTIENLENIDTYNSLLDFKRAGGVLSIDLRFKNYLNVTGNLRQDYSNKFGADTNGFTSYGLGADLSINDLIASDDTGGENDPIKFLLHTSFGRFGNDFGIGNGLGAYIDASIDGDPFISSNSISGFVPNDLVANKKLTSEEIVAFDAGLDITTQNKRLNFSIVYYNEQSNGLILRAPIANSSGHSSLMSNLGSMSNEGFDISLYFEPLRKENFSWALNLNFNKNQNVVESLDDFNSEIFLSGFIGTRAAAVINQPYSVILGRAFERNDDGKMIIGADGFPLLGAANEVLANPNPDWTLFVNNTFKVGKRISLKGIVDIKQGGEMYCGTCGTLDYFGRSQRSADERGVVIIFDGVTESGAVNTKPVELAPSDGNQDQFYRVRYGFGGIGEMSIYDASWVRLRSLSVQYDLKDLIKLKILNQLAVTVFAENLILITNYPGIDPETNLTGNNGGIGIDYYNNPGIRRYGLTLKASF